MQNLQQYPPHLIQDVRRRSLKITQSQLAKKLGVNRTFVSFAFTGKNPELLNRIVKVLDEEERTN